MHFKLSIETYVRKIYSWTLEPFRMHKKSGIICTGKLILCPQMINANRQLFSLLGIVALYEFSYL